MTTVIKDPITGINLTIPDNLLEKFTSAGYITGKVMQEAQERGLDELKMSELKEIASAEGIDISLLKSKKDVAAAIEESRSAVG